MAAAVKQAVDSWPPLTAEQREAIAAMFGTPVDSGNPDEQPCRAATLLRAEGGGSR